DNGYYGKALDLAKNIIDVIPRHHAYVNQLKNDGYHIIGYCRKSKMPSNNRAALLQRMVNILRQRSLVDKVFVSSYSNIKQGFYKRDLNDQDSLLSELDQVNGNTQAFIQDNDKVCVVALDYAGFTTNMSDLKNILRQVGK
ncbi:uncharacterized protein BX663DRAFT_436212, partial [Cokeromyces recurvatus]|uniref:uncharacterized protein n=1 Tax=Cokeromyces recurvatus TaxID=90255 RepID=UPI00221FC084